MNRLKLLRRLWSYRYDVAGAVVHWSGIGRVFEAVVKPKGAIILMYHSVAQANDARFIDPPNRISPEKFELQMAFLGKHRRVVPMSQLVDIITSGISPPAGTVCITFDDGYLDNLTVAAPILEKHGLAATLYLPTRYIDHCEMQWADRLYWIFNYRALDKLSLSSIGLEDVNMASSASRMQAQGLLHRYLLEADFEGRERLLGELERQLAPVERPPQLMMSWDNVREICRRYPFIEIGGHTRDHMDLRTHCGEDARSQITGCADDLRRQLGFYPAHFSFPYSRWCAETRNIVSSSGWKSAVGMGEDMRIEAKSNRFAMPRVESPRTMTELRFKTSASYPGALSVFGLM